MIERAIVQAKRDALAARLEAARAQYDALEQTLHTLDRQLCAMAGGLQELDALLSQAEQTARATNGFDPLATQRLRS